MCILEISENIANVLLVENKTSEPAMSKGLNNKQAVTTTVARAESDVQPLAMPRYDPVDYILDKIDYEFYNTERVSP